MGKYLKNDLKMDQLLTPSFLGIYHDPENYEHPILKLKEYDMSTLNWYSVSPSKFQGIGKSISNFNEVFQQPFFFGEIGNADLYPCDTARIEWVRDAWMSAFSGNAGIGMNWDDPFDDELRKHLGNIHAFVNGIDFDNNGDPWTSRRVISDNRSVETIYLISPDNSHAVGVISNRYFNWMMYADTTHAECKGRVSMDMGFYPNHPSGQKGTWEREYDDNPINYIDRIPGSTQMNDSIVFYPFKAIAFDTNLHSRIKFYDLRRGNYTIEFYNALTMELLDTRTNWGPNIKLEYPEMNESSGLIAFKIRLNKEGGFPQTSVENRIPIDYENAITVSEKRNYSITNNRYKLTLDRRYKECSIELLDNPKGNNFQVDIYDKKGTMILSETFEELTYKNNVNGLTKGYYLVKITINRVTYTEEIMLR